MGTGQVSVPGLGLGFGYDGQGGGPFGEDVRRLLALPAHRRLRVPVRLRGDGAGRAERRGRVDVPAPDGLPEHLRRAAGPRRRLVPVRPGGHDGPGRPALPAGHHGPGDQLGLRRGLAGGPRLPGDGAVAARPPGPQHAPPAADRLRRRAHPAAHRAVHERLGPAQHGLRARLRLRPPARPLGAHRPGLPPGGDRPGGRRHDADADLGHPDRAGGAERQGQDPAQGGRDPVLRAVLGQPQAARTTTRTRPPGSSGPPTTGSTGWPGARSPTIAGAPT